MTTMEADGGLTEEIEHIKDVGWTAVVGKSYFLPSGMSNLHFILI